MIPKTLALVLQTREINKQISADIMYMGICVYTHKYSYTEITE